MKIKVEGKMDTSKTCGGTVTIDRKRKLFSVRPHRRRREYTLPLGVVADIVVARVIRAEEGL